ncbi:hypothetical protein AVEN_53911-1 [Araneus ventricosus]|uniref:Endonuclease/exonuclease/phosphatase domain-containing protein n=1 Tax=Araneus ventricosus TaxID=182803 RepID=A0A4Y2IEE4_ARAVE|nr:hypothetical protein AVEN_53911-1 [Araneus ventricosus]
MDFSSHSSINLTTSSTSISINILQINLARTRAASYKLQNSIVNFNSDIILMQEPYSRAEKIQGFPQSCTIFPSKTNKAAIAIVNKNLKPAIIASKKYTVAVKLQTGQNPTTFISAYNSPYANIQETLQELQEIITSLKGESIIIGADLNGHHTMWGYRDIDSTGERILEFLLANNLFIANNPDAPPTFERGIFKGWPDFTISTQDIISKFAKWEVSEEPSLSDHK